MFEIKDGKLASQLSDRVIERERYDEICQYIETLLDQDGNLIFNENIGEMPFDVEEIDLVLQFLSHNSLLTHPCT